MSLGEIKGWLESTERKLNQMHTLSSADKEQLTKVCFDYVIQVLKTIPKYLEYSFI